METQIDIELKTEFLSDNHIDLQSLPREAAGDLSYDQFFHRYMSTNTLVMISGIHIKTKVLEKWFDKYEKLRLENLQDILSKDHEVPIANCSKQIYDSHEKAQMKFSDYLSYWNERGADDKLYLKDFHMKQEFPEIDFYNVPSYFASDWLNEYLIDERKDDYRFVYIGPKDTW